MFGMSIISSIQLPLLYFSTYPTLSLILLATYPSRFLDPVFCLAMPCPSPLATLLQHIAILEQATAGSYACACQLMVARTSHR